MDTSKTITSTNDRDLILTRLVQAPPASVYRAWTDPDLLKQWFAPLPWTVPSATLDVRVGGSNEIVMRGPDGTEFPNRGVYLAVEADKRLVFTDAYTGAWEPSSRPFMTVTATFEEEAGGTRYTVVVHHWSVADREEHEKMGFHIGWPICTEQLAALVERG